MTQGPGLAPSAPACSHARTSSWGPEATRQAKCQRREQTEAGGPPRGWATHTHTQHMHTMHMHTKYMQHTHTKHVHMQHTHAHTKHMHVTHTNHAHTHAAHAAHACAHEAHGLRGRAGCELPGEMPTAKQRIRNRWLSTGPDAGERVGSLQDGYEEKTLF